MAPRTNPPNLHPGLTAHEAALDPIIRFVQGLDFNDEASVRSAFTADAVFEIPTFPTKSSPEEAAAAPQPPKEYRGIEAILANGFAKVGPMATTHHVSNSRVLLAENGREAVVTAYGLAQHFPPGKVHSAEGQKGYLMGNYYAVDVVKEEGEGGLWRIKRFELSCLWSDGDVGVMAGI